MFKIAKKLTVIMLSASIIFSCSGIIAHAEGIKDKKQEYYQEYKRIIREAYYREMKSLKQGYNIVFLWNKKEKVEDVEFHKIHKEIKEIFEEANLIEKV